MLVVGLGTQSRCEGMWEGRVRGEPEDQFEKGHSSLSVLLGECGKGMWAGRGSPQPADTLSLTQFLERAGSP